MKPSTIMTAASLLLKALATPLLITDSLTITGNTTPPVIAARQGKVQYGGVNIAGFDFGCSTWNGCNPAGANTNTPDMLNQIAHFTAEGLNAFRLPVGWDFLATAPDTLNQANLAIYDKLVRGCTSSSAQLCIIDMYSTQYF
jgi:endoglucanase